MFNLRKNKKKNALKVLAIDPGTRNMGVALLENGKLIYHGVQVIKQQISPQETLKEGKKAVVRLIDDFKPTHLAIEKTYFGKHRNVNLVSLFFEEIKGIGKRKKLKVVCYAPNTIKKFTCGNGRASKEDVAKVIVAKFPELIAYINQDKKWKDRHHQNMFDAMALGVMASERF
jgi:crossover junction endodeoxyribonuclease RuvC